MIHISLRRRGQGWALDTGLSDGPRFAPRKRCVVIFSSSFHCILAVVSVPELFAFPCSLPPAHISQCVWACPPCFYPASCPYSCPNSLPSLPPARIGQRIGARTPCLPCPLPAGCADCRKDRPRLVTLPTSGGVAASETITIKLGRVSFRKLGR